MSYLRDVAQVRAPLPIPFRERLLVRNPRDGTLLYLEVLGTSGRRWRWATE